MYNIKNINNLLNNDNNKDNEILFWKVINNKYLFRKIFHFIETVEWVNNKRNYNTSDTRKTIESDNCIDSSTRIKFKYIYNAEWMIKHNQFQLLKMKLSNNNEYIEIDDMGVYKKLLSLNIGSGSDSNNNTTTSELSCYPTTTCINLELFKEILQLFIERIKHSYTSNELTSIALECTSLQIINILFEVLNDGTTLESSIRYYLNEDTDYRVSLKSIKNYKLLDAILGIISNDQQQHQQQDNKNKPIIAKSFKKLKSFCAETVINKPQNHYMDMHEFLQIGNVKTQIKVMDLNLLGLYNYSIDEFSRHIVKQLENSGKDERHIDDIIVSLLIGLRIIYNLNEQKQEQEQEQEQQQQQQHQNQQVLDKSLTTKELFKKYIILSKSTELFSIYLSKYNQIDSELLENENFRIIASEYSMDNFNIDIFKCLINSNSFKLKNVYKLKEQPISSNYNLLKSIEFLKLYLSNLSTITNNNNQKHGIIIATTIHIIYDIIFEIKDSKQYEQFVNNEIPKFYQMYIPLKWNSIINQLNDPNKSSLNIIKDIETIDWIEKWILYLSNFDKLYCKYIFCLLHFENAELSEYAYNKLQFTNFNQSSFYQTTLVKAIIEIDLKTIKHIHSLNINSIFKSNIFDGNIKRLLSNSKLGSGIGGNKTVINYQEFNKIIEYLIQMDENGQAIFQLVDFIVDNGYYNDSKYNVNNKDDNGNNLFKFDLGQVKINLSNLQYYILSELQRKCCNYNHFKFLLENVKFTNQGDLHEYVGEYLHSLKNHQNRSNLIISLIHLLIDQLNQCREIINSSLLPSTTPPSNDNKGDDQELPNLQVYYSLLDSLFNGLGVIDNQELWLTEIELVHKLLIENQVPLVLGNNFKLAYIKCTFPILYDYLNFIVMNDYYEIPTFKLFETYSFDQLLELVIFRPYQNQHGNEIEYKYDHYVYIQYNLMFFINIKRIDLFLKEWELVKSEGEHIKNMGKTLIKLICINLELSQINDILEETEFEYRQLYEFCIISLQLGIFEITKLAFYHLRKHSSRSKHRKSQDDKFNTLINSNIEDILKNRYELIQYLNSPHYIL